VFQHSTGVHLYNKNYQRGRKWLSGALKNTVLRKRMDNRMERNCSDSVNKSLEFVVTLLKFIKAVISIAVCRKGQEYYVLGGFAE